MFNFLKKIILLITTLIGFSGFGVLGIICYPYFYITGFRENEARYFFYIISKFVFLLLKPAAKSFKVEFKGNWPKNGAIITPNHSSILDILCFCELGVKDIVFLVKGWPFKVPLMGRYAKAAGNIALEDNKNFKSLREKVKKALEKNLKVIIFPEGTRSKCGKAGRFHSGAFALASELNAPIVPMAIKGLGETIPKNKILINSVDIKLTILPEVKDFEKNDTSASKMAKYIRNIIIKELEEK